MQSEQLRAIWHPARAQIFETLTKGPANLSELVQASGGRRQFAKVVYHSRVLCRAGCIQTVESPGSDSSDPLFEVA